MEEVGEAHGEELFAGVAQRALPARAGLVEGAVGGDAEEQVVRGREELRPARAQVDLTRGAVRGILLRHETFSG